MSTNAAEVAVGITGAVYSADQGATVTAPTTSQSTVDTDLFNLGYVNEDGVEEAYDDTIEEIVAWQNATVVRSLTTESKATLKFVLIQTKGKVLELYHKGSEVTVAGSGEWKIEVKAPTPDRRCFLIDVIDGSKHIRIWVPDGEVTEREPIAYKNDEPIAYSMTITCYPDANNVVLTKFSNDASWGYS